MNAPRLIATVLAALGLAPIAATAETAPAKPFVETLEAIRTESALPALGAAACIDGKIVDLAVTGFRQQGGSGRVTPEDLWHIGSITKSMTATLAGTLVDEGKIRWDTTVGEVLKDLAGENSAWKDITLEQLLQHRAGAPGKPPAQLWAAAWKRTGTPTKQRTEFVRGLLGGPLEFPAGQSFQYSNQGYSVAGLMLERITQTPWETLMEQRIFKPLGMASGGFGAPGTPGKNDQPLGHSGTASLKPVPVGPAADNPAAIGPGGIVHCSLADLVRYAQWHCDGTGTEATRLRLKPETLARLHQPAAGGEYAMGWNVYKRDWAGGTTLMHNGTNTMWYAVIWISPARHAAFAAVTNAASPAAAKACDTAVAELIRRTLPSPQ